MADFKQMAMDAYNQRNNQNVSDKILLIRYFLLIHDIYGYLWINKKFSIIINDFEKEINESCDWKKI